MSLGAGTLGKSTTSAKRKDGTRNGRKPSYLRMADGGWSYSIQHYCASVNPTNCPAGMAVCAVWGGNFYSRRLRIGRRPIPLLPVCTEGDGEICLRYSTCSMTRFPSSCDGDLSSFDTNIGRDKLANLLWLMHITCSSQCSADVRQSAARIGANARRARNNIDDHS